MSVLDKIEKEQLRHELSFAPGDQVRVHVKIVEGDKERIQVFEGVVLCVHRGGNRASFTVRKMSYGVGVERIFPVHAPTVDKVEVVSSGRVRRGRLFYLRDLAGKAAKLKAREDGPNAAEILAPATTAPAAEA